MLAINSGSALGREEMAFAAVLGNQRVGPLGIAVEDRDPEPMPCRVSREVCAHHGQSHNADVSFVSHGFSAHFGDRSAVLAPETKGGQIRRQGSREPLMEHARSRWRHNG